MRTRHPDGAESDGRISGPRRSFVLPRSFAALRMTALAPLKSKSGSLRRLCLFEGAQVFDKVDEVLRGHLLLEVFGHDREFHRAAFFDFGFLDWGVHTACSAEGDLV